MTSLPPPTYYFTGITFNSAYYPTSSSSGLTQTQANGLYLRKNTADTASALETFSGGIVTNGINPTTTTGTIAIGTSSTFTTLAGGVSVTNNLTTPAIDPVLSGGNFNVGCGVPNVLNLGTANATEVTVGNSTNIANIKSGTFNLQNDATTAGSVNIKNSTVATGSVNIASGGGTAGTSTVTVDIASGITSGTVTIGNSANTTTLKSNTINAGSNTGTANFYGVTNVGRNTGGTADSYVEMACGGGNAVMDFHSSGAKNVDYDSRIIASGGSTAVTPLDGKGTLELISNTLTLTAPTVNVGGTLAMGSGKNITLSGTVTPTAGSQLGGLTQGTITSTVATPATLDIPTAGVYLFTWNITLNCGGVYTTWANSQISGTGVLKYQSHPYSVVNSFNSVGTSGSMVINATASTYSITFVGSSTAYSVSSTYSFFQAVRIA